MQFFGWHFLWYPPIFLNKSLQYDTQGIDPSKYLYNTQGVDSSKYLSLKVLIPKGQSIWGDHFLKKIMFQKY